MIQEGSLLWQYLSPQQRMLADDGKFLFEDSARHPDEEPTDYSYVVFPFAKLYEGFLKQLFLDIGIITEHEYNSDRFRIGKVLSPNLVRLLKYKSAYGQITERFGKDLATRIWHTWKNGRNLVFHYFPHNYRALTRSQAASIITNIIDTMDATVQETHVRPR
jgi:hypothetical protein